MDTGSTFSEWRDRVLLRSLQVHQRWRSRWHPRFRRLFSGSGQNLITDVEVNVAVPHDITADSVDPVDEGLPTDDDKENISMPDNNGENDKEVEPISTNISAPMKIGGDKASDTQSVEGMSEQPFSTSKRECSEHSQSQDSIAGESNYTPPAIEVVVLTKDAEDNTSLTKLGTPDGSTVRATGSVEGPMIRVIPPSLALNVRPEPGAVAARKSPVTVQEWVDSLPPPRLREDNTSEPWPTPRPAGALVREPSVQSDAGSHCSSVESLLGSRRADPEQILMGLGFGGAGNDCDSDVSRIPRRFLRPSKVKGVVIDDFLKHQHDLVQTFESGFNGYRGLTGSGHRPSVIVAKIMEKLRGGSTGSASPPPSPAGKRFSRVARKVMNVLPSSVLTPDNRRFLDDQGGKSPEVPRKRMIIGQRSFTFDRDGEMIELRAAAKSISISSTDSNKNPTADHILSTSLSLSSSERDIDNQSFVPNLTSPCRSLSLDSSEAPPAHSTPNVNLTEEPQTTPPDLEYPSFKPSFSVSSRSVSIDSSDSPSLAHLPPLSDPEGSWDVSASQRRNRFSSTSLSSWESMSPKGDFERPFPRYESIEETSEKGDLSSDPGVSMTNEDVRTPLQLRRGSLKRQQHVEEDVTCNPDPISHILEESEVFSSRDTLSQLCDEDNLSMDSSMMECLLNPVEMQQIEEIDEDIVVESIKVPSPENSLQQLPESSCQDEEAADTMQMRVVATLMRARSDSSGFLDLDGDVTSGDERNTLAPVHQNQRELDELVQELKERGVNSARCCDTAVRLALTSYGDQLKAEAPPSADLPEARCDLDTLCQLRETVAAELRRVADLLDEQPSATRIPIVTTQMTALLRQQTKLRRQLEALSCESTSLEDIPSCCNMLSLVRGEHRHLENLIEQNSRELADIRQLLHELLATHR